MIHNSHPSTRRRFVRAGFGATALGSAAVFGQTTSAASGDLAILKFAAAAEIIAADIWTQMAEQVAVSQMLGSSLGSVDPTLPRIILDIARDERSHAEFLNACLVSIGGQRVDFDMYRTLQAYTTAGSAICGSSAGGTSTGGTSTGGGSTGGTSTGGTSTGGTSTGGTSTGGTSTGGTSTSGSTNSGTNGFGGTGINGYGCVPSDLGVLAGSPSSLGTGATGRLTTSLT